MSERASFSPESHRDHIESGTEKETSREHSQEQFVQTEHDEAKLDDLRQNIENQAVSGKEVAVGDKETTDNSSAAVTKDLKLRAYWRTLHRIQTRLSPSQRRASRIIHKPSIDKVSSISAQTVARSYALLCGAATALLGSLILIAFARRTGIQYNYSAFFFLFVAGYIIGLILELIAKLIRPKH